jgi:small subunit ribosomal protein S9
LNNKNILEDNGMAEEEKKEEAKSQEVDEQEEKVEEAEVVEESETTEEVAELEAAMGEEEAEEEKGPEKPIVKHEGRFYGTGRRKQAVARVWVEAGEGNITVNDKPLEDYFMNRAIWLNDATEPLECVDMEEKIDVVATLEGGGKTGQAGALKLGIARALVEMDHNARHWLHADGLMTRDDRAVERKKINQPGARAKAQVSKR